MTFLLKKYTFSIFFVQNLIISKLEIDAWTLKRRFFSLKKVWPEVIWGHIRLLLFIAWKGFVKFRRYYNIIEMQFFLRIKYLLRSHSTICIHAMERLCGFLTFRFSDIMTTLTHVHMNNFFPCFLKHLAE